MPSMSFLKNLAKTAKITLEIYLAIKLHKTFHNQTQAEAATI